MHNFDNLYINNIYMESFRKAFYSVHQENTEYLHIGSVVKENDQYVIEIINSLDNSVEYFYIDKKTINVTYVDKYSIEREAYFY